MGRSAKISPIPVEYPKNFLTQEGSLAMKGYYRTPGTFRTFFPYLETPGYYRTGLDENAAYLDRLPKEERESEIKRIREDKARLEKKTGLDLSPTSDFYNYGSHLPDSKKVYPVKLGNGDLIFNLNDPMQEITWNWIRVYPAIATSLDAYRRGEYNQLLDVKWYVADDKAEARNTYSKKKAINDAITSFNTASPTKKKQIGRLMGLPITESTTEEEVYNLVDNKLKEAEIKEGDYKGRSVIAVFNDLFKMSDDRLEVKDIIDQAIRNSIYRIKAGSGRIYEGEREVAKSKQDLIDILLDQSNQEDLLALKSKLKYKKLASV